MSDTVSHWHQMESPETEHLCARRASSAAQNDGVKLDPGRISPLRLLSPVTTSLGALRRSVTVERHERCALPIGWKAQPPPIPASLEQSGQTLSFTPAAAAASLRTVCVI